MHNFAYFPKIRRTYLWACSNSNGLYGTFGLILVLVTFKGIAILTERILTVYG